jgi:hypothetical protein
LFLHPTIVIEFRHSIVRCTFLKILSGDVRCFWYGFVSEKGSMQEHTKILEWFRPPKRNTLQLLLLYCSRENESTKLEKACVCGLPEEGLCLEEDLNGNQIGLNGLIALLSGWL